MSQKYKYKALTHSGDKVSDYLFAVDESAARSELKKQSLIVVSVELDAEKSFFSNKKNASASDVEQSTNQLATLLENGLRINDALEVLIDTAPSEALGKVWHEVFIDVQAGTPLYKSLQKYPELFDVLYLEMTNIAENTGTLPAVFRSLADNLAFQRDLKSKTIQALTYPLIIFMVCLCAVFAIFNFVIPNMESIFTSATELPGYTQWLLESSRFVSQNNLLIFILMAGFVLTLITLWRQESTRQTLIQWISVMPLLGGMIDKAEQIRFSSAMTLTLQSGLNLSESLALSIKTLNSAVNKQQLELAKIKVDAGSPLAESLSSSYFLDRISLSLIKVGEQSGTLDSSFAEVTRRSKTNFESWMIKLTSLLEPLLILIMGGIVGGVVVVMLLSIVSVNDISL
ncbi:type II secretion system F family protein [Colwellia sp. E2M01]|uniref:type II secretion system F family protein n=1 Tax=Colwellia sp. E2M01 TaxID=2841561 RepID=UPI001C095442|nr:type II secretion system F family protein [Colwellia sp. E2M01]MBU2869354.1 type II secretion system F family protein [Colwellia sp. E2M01]